MPEVKWIKITTDVFDDEKILLIESLPSADSIIVIWFKLLTLAGKQNNNGVFVLNDKIAFTDEMLATIFRRDVNVVRLALSVFEKYGMIDMVSNVVTIPNWNKYQNLDAYEKKKERDRQYQAQRRLKQKTLALDTDENRSMSDDVSDDLSSCVAVSEEDIDKDIDKTIKEKNIKKRKVTRHKYGQYENVLLSDEELEKLKNEFPDSWERWIEKVSSYVASTGKTYKNYLATIRVWARKERERNTAPAHQDEWADVQKGTWI